LTQYRPAKPIDYLVLVLIPLLSSITPIAVGAARQTIYPLIGGCIRFGVAGVGLLILLKATGQLRTIERRDWRRIVLLAVICVPVNQYAFFEGVHLSNSSHGGIIYAATPVIVTVAMCLLGVERWTVTALGGVTLAVAGVAVIMWQSFASSAGGGPHDTGSYLRGDLLLLAAVTTWSLYLVFSRPLTLRYGSLSTQAWVFVVGALLSVPLLGKDLAAMEWRAVTWQSWAGIAYLSIMVAGVVFFLFNWAMVRQPPSRVATFSNAAPPLTLLWNAMMHKGYLNGGFVAGSALLLGGMACTLWKVKMVVGAEECPAIEEAV
jgi:drug/metabolite transporter (DMT)-like permease